MLCEWGHGTGHAAGVELWHGLCCVRGSMGTYGPVQCESVALERVEGTGLAPPGFPREQRPLAVAATAALPLQSGRLRVPIPRTSRV